VADTNISKNRLLFNYKNYLKSKKISAVVFVEGEVTTLKENYSHFNSISSNFKSYAERTFYDSLNDSNADIILSVLLGNVAYLDEGFYDNVKAMGLAHIFAVSGTHIVLIYGFLLTVLKYCGLKRRVVNYYMDNNLVLWFFDRLSHFGNEDIDYVYSAVWCGSLLQKI